MAQKAARETQVVIGDKTYRVCFSILGIVALRDHWGLESDDEVMLRLRRWAINSAVKPAARSSISS
jgi:hypothetical protein